MNASTACLSSTSALLRKALERCLEPGVYGACGLIEAHDRDLMPGERAALGRAAPRRRFEYAAGRRMAREALQALDGTTCAELPTGPNGDTQWPPGITGSISHSRDCCAAIVAARGRFGGLGLDIEHSARLKEAVARRIMTNAEWAWHKRQPAAQQQAWQAFFFSAKEAVFKCLYPLHRRNMTFREVNLLPARDGRFEWTWTHASPPLPPGGEPQARGRFAFAGSLVTTIAFLYAGS